jgi:hypothetical protein
MCGAWRRHTGPWVAVVGHLSRARQQHWLAGRKVIAFDRAEARDFADVYALAQRHGTGRLIELAVAVDRGFDVGVLTTMLNSLARFSDQEIPVPADTDVSIVREFFRTWSRQLCE